MKQKINNNKSLKTILNRKERNNGTFDEMTKMLY